MDPAPPTHTIDLPGPSQPIPWAQEEDSSIALLIDKLDNVADAVSRVEAQLCWLKTLQEVAALKKEMSKKCIPHPQSSEYQPLPPSLYPCSPLVPLPPLQEMSTLGPIFWHGPDNLDMQMKTPAVIQDISSWANITSPPCWMLCISKQSIDPWAAKLSLEGKPGCSAGSKDIYTEGKNQQQLLWKTRETTLDQEKLKAIFISCMQDFLLQRLEMQLNADKEMQYAVDEVCRKSKTTATA